MLQDGLRERGRFRKVGIDPRVACRHHQKLNAAGGPSQRKSNAKPGSEEGNANILDEPGGPIQQYLTLQNCALILCVVVVADEDG
jgi:hypothetical protein